MGTWFHSDAVQALGKRSVDFRALNAAGVHALTLSAHKANGPKGAGALVIDKRVELQPQIAGGGHGRGLRSGTENVPAIVGFGIAAELAAQRLAEVPDRLNGLRLRLESGLAALGAVIFAVNAEKLPNTCYFAFQDIDGETLVGKLDYAKVLRFTGKTTLQVCGQWLSRGDELRGTFLVYTILSCSHSFPFKRLVYQLRNEASRARGPNGQQAGDVQTRNKAGGSKLPSKPGIEEDDASSRLAPHGYQFRGGRNFPYLAGKFVRAVSKVEPAGATTSTSSSQAVEELGVGASGTSARRREALLEDVDQGRSREIPGFLKAAVAGLNSLE